MSALSGLLYILNHLDLYLDMLIRNFGIWTYLILWLVIFLETGLVVTPFLPGDSLIFIAGTFAAIGSMNVWLLFVLLWSAAVLGDTVNYWIGRKVGAKVFSLQNSKLFSKKNFDRTYHFYEKYGSQTIVLARFIPIIRTFAPFVAGVAKMKYLTFVSYNIIGAFLWVTLALFLGYFFGNVPWIKNHFSIVIILIIIISTLPVIYKFLFKSKK